MMELLFHGKRIDTNEWIEGSSINTQYDIEGKKHIYIGILFYPNVTQFPLMQSLAWFEVIPESTGQYIGVKDKNNKKIFENDIIRTQPCSDRPHSKKAKFKEHIGVVKYKIYHHKGTFSGLEQDYKAVWDVDIKDMDKYSCYSWSLFFDCEVIGNLYDTPELLN